MHASVAEVRRASWPYVVHASVPHAGIPPPVPPEVEVELVPVPPAWPPVPCPAWPPVPWLPELPQAESARAAIVDEMNAGRVRSMTARITAVHSFTSNESSA